MSDKNKGFTITELLVAMVIAGIVMTAIYSVYSSQQKSYVTQEQAAAMQQNLRAAMFYVARDIRMAGCDPTGNANAGIITADATSIHFTKDTRGAAHGSASDGDTLDPDENITYSLYDAYSDGDNDLGRKVGDGNNQPVAENIDALAFTYIFADGDAGLPDETDADPTNDCNDIRSVQITIVARAERPDRGYTDTQSYTNKQGTVILAAQNDHFRRRFLTTTIKCRNLGL